MDKPQIFISYSRGRRQGAGDRARPSFFGQTGSSRPGPDLRSSGPAIGAGDRGQTFVLREQWSRHTETSGRALFRRGRLDAFFSEGDRGQTFVLRGAGHTSGGRAQGPDLRSSGAVESAHRDLGTGLVQTREVRPRKTGVVCGA
jgi:hypothetical protein